MTEVPAETCLPAQSVAAIARALAPINSVIPEKNGNQRDDWLAFMAVSPPLAKRRHTLFREPGKARNLPGKRDVPDSRRALAMLARMPHKKSTTTLLVVLCEVLLSGATHAAPLPNINTIVTIDADYFGCRALDDLARVMNLDWVKNDKEAASAYGQEHCTALHKGDQFKVRDVSVVHGAVCLSQGASSECFWTNAQMLKTP